MRTLFYWLSGGRFWCWRHLRLKEFGPGPLGCGSCMVARHYDNVVRAGGRRGGR